MCLSKFLDLVPQLIPLLKRIKLVNHLSYISLFLTQPAKFWRNYNRLPKKQKIIQYFLYACFFLLVFWISSSAIVSYRAMLKVLLIEIASMIPYIIVVWLSLLLSKSYRNGSAFVRSFVLCSYAKFLIVPFELIGLLLYVYTESVVYIGLAALVTLIAEIYVLVSPFTFINSDNPLNSKLIYLGYAFVLVNIIDIFFIVSGFDWPRQDNLRDRITEERYEQTKSIQNPYLIPIYVCLGEKSGTQYYLYSQPNDNKARKDSMEDSEYYRVLQADIDSLKVISNRCRFAVNRDFFNSLYQVKKRIQYIHQHNLYDSNPIVKETVFMYNDIEVDKLRYLIFDEEVKRAIIQLFERDITLSKHYQIAISTQHLGYLWHIASFGQYIGYKSALNESEESSGFAESE